MRPDFLPPSKRGLAAAKRGGVYRKRRRNGRADRTDVQALMRVRWTVPAAEDLEGIKRYLDQRYPHFAEPTVRTIYQRICALKTAPYRGRPGHRSGTRELPITPLPYIVVYAVKHEAVEILHIYHGSQDWR
jgi:toxin ParE1/3/4